MLHKRQMLEGDQVQQQWRPKSLRPPVLLVFAILTLAMIALLGFIQIRVSNNGEVLRSQDSNSFSLLQNIAFRYLPTLAVVLFAVGWNWIEQDIRRMEPWYQLSRPEGATVSSSLTLHYPSEFLPIAPITAFRNKQYIVALATLSMLIVSLVINPLQNGIFAVRHKSISERVRLRTATNLLSLEEQTQRLNSSFMGSAYASIWLGQSLPAYSTATSALFPFYIDESFLASGVNGTFEAPSTQYLADIECVRAEDYSLAPGSSLTFDDGRGCVAEGIVNVEPALSDEVGFRAYYYGYYPDDHAHAWLQGPKCPAEFINTFAAIYRNTTGSKSNTLPAPNSMTALFCRPSYYSQQVSARVRYADSSVLSTTETGDRVPLNSSVFDATLFEYILAAGFSPKTLRQDIISAASINQEPQVANMTSLKRPIHNMIGFSLGLTHLSADKYLDPTIFTDALRAAYQQTFALAVQNLLERPAEAPMVEGIYTADHLIVDIVAPFLYLSGAFALLIFCLTCYLLRLIRRRPLGLQRDPASISEVMTLTRDIAGVPICDQKLLRQSNLYGRYFETRFHLRPTLYSEEPVISILEEDEIGASRSKPVPHSSDISTKIDRDFTCRWPIEYSRLLGSGVIIFLTGILVLLFLLRSVSGSQRGLRLPFNNKFYQQLMFNVLPTISAALLESFLTLLCRTKGSLIPFQELRAGDAKAVQSLLVAYGSMPAQVVFWKALRRQHPILASLSVITALANVFTVAFGGVFMVIETDMNQPASFQPLYLPRLRPVMKDDSIFTNSIYNNNDMFHLLNTNALTGTALLPWTTVDTYFLPVSFADIGAPLALDNVKFNATGYSSDLDCVPMTEKRSGLTPPFFAIDLYRNPNSSQVNLTYLQPNGAKLECMFYASGLAVADGTHTNRQLWADISSTKDSAAAFEANGQVSFDEDPTGLFDQDDEDLCRRHFVHGWLRAHGLNVESSQDSIELTSTLISCMPRLKTADYEVFSNSNGDIQAAHRTSPYTYHDSILPTDNSTADSTREIDFDYALTRMTDILARSTTPGGWHNDSVATDWIEYFIRHFTINSTFLDPDSPVPDPQVAMKRTSEVFTRLFPIHTHLLRELLIPAPATQVKQAAFAISKVRRVFLSEPAFWVCVVILSLDIMVLVTFYIDAARKKPFLTKEQMPWSIASVMSVVQGSRILEDVANADLKEESGRRKPHDTNAEDAANGFSERLEVLDEKGWRYGFGKFIGKDGKVKVGVEREPFVTSLDRKDRSEDIGRGKQWIKRERE